MTDVPGPDADGAPVAQSRPDRSRDRERWAGLRRRCLSLGTGELVAAAVFALFLGFGLDPIAYDDEVNALWFALGPLLFILVQAGIYWLIVRSRVPHPLPPGVAAVYRVLRVLNPFVLAAGAVGVALSLDGPTPAIVLFAAIWLFGVIEYVNYFIVRLAYPVSSWLAEVGRWSTPRLVRDIRIPRG